MWGTLATDVCLSSQVSENYLPPDAPEIHTLQLTIQFRCQFNHRDVRKLDAALTLVQQSLDHHLVVTDTLALELVLAVEADLVLVAHNVVEEAEAVDASNQLLTHHSSLTRTQWK